MNENVDLTKILENCPKGWELYSPLFGIVTFSRIFRNPIDYDLLTIEVIDNEKKYWYFYAENGKFVHLNKKYVGNNGRVGDSFILSKECLLFPSKDRRDWSKFSAPWYKREKFDPKTLQQFDRVVVKNILDNIWRIQYFSHIDRKCKKYPFICLNACYTYCIPYNEETKHLVGTTKEPPVFYRYWDK